MNNLQPHLKVKKGDISSYILLPGDPQRVYIIGKRLKNFKIMRKNREFTIGIGKYKKTSVTICSTGIGSPSAAIAVEELARVGAQVFIRIGTCGALKKEIEPGNLIIPSRALRQEGTTKEYVNDNYEAWSDKEILEALKNSANRLNFRYFVGVNRTHDAFYEPTDNFLRLMDLPEYKKGELVSSEMECSAIFTVARLRGLKAGAVLAVNTSEPLEEISKNPNLVYQLEVSPRAAKGVNDAIQVALMAIEFLNKKDKI